MPKYLSKSQEAKWEKAKKIVEEQKGKSSDKFKDRDFGLTMHIMQNMKSKKKKKKKKKASTGLLSQKMILDVMLPLSLRKKAVSVIIAPFEPIVQKAIELLEKIRPGYFSGIKNIVVEQSQSGGDPFHYGKVESDKLDTIYINMSAIRSAAGGANNDEALIKAAAEVLAHEMGHLKDKLQSGEGPAENEEHRISNVLNSEGFAELYEGFILIGELQQKYLFKDADLVERSTFHKIALIPNYVKPEELSQTILRIIYHFAQKVSPERQKDYLMSFARKLAAIDQLTISEKKKNPGAGLGASVSLIKNLLSGHTQIEIDNILRQVLGGLSSL